MRVALGALSLAFLVLFGCQAADDPTRQSAAPSPNDVGHCDGAGVEPRDDVDPEFDVDGDGAADPVTLIHVEEGGPGCRNFLMVGEHIVPTNPEGIDYGLREPQVHGFVQIDDVGGVEVLVELERGASSRFVGLFTFTGGRLQRVEVEDVAAPLGLLPYGGSIGRVETSNCDARNGADLSVTAADPVANGYRVQTTLFDMSGPRLVALPEQRQPPPRMRGDLGSLDQLANAPFASCASS